MTTVFKMTGCSAPNCSKSSRKGYRLFVFPRDPERRRTWLQQCRRNLWEPTNSSRLCECHFEDSQFEQVRRDGWKKLKPNAVPTIFDIHSCSEGLQSKRKCPREQEQLHDNMEMVKLEPDLDGDNLELSLANRQCFFIKQENFTVEDAVINVKIEKPEDEEQDIDPLNVKQESDDDATFICNEEALKNIKTEKYVLPEICPVTEECTKLTPDSGTGGTSDKICNIASHNSQNSLNCDICNTIIESSSVLNTHQCVHAAEHPFLCKVCSKTLSSRDCLKRHQRIHMTECTYSCDICDKTFAIRDYLLRHYRLHVNHCSFSCDICNRTFSSKEYLKRHQLVHTGEHSFSCETCKKTFNRKCHLKRHHLVHTGKRSFSCDMCHRQFTFNSDLKKHKLNHTGKRAFQCDVCTKAFSRKENLKTHLRLHSFENQYLCDICSKSFKYKNCLKKHQGTHSRR